jgi:hypothetical protein
VDAYILLAEEEATSDEERCALYLEAVRVGERELGPESFEYNRGMFWQIVETRPYMRAKAGLAQSLIEVGDESGAIQQHKDILSLNPGDNQAIRYPLIDLLLLKKDEPNYLAYLFERYKGDCMAHFLYNRALWFYSKHKMPEANVALRNALMRNPYVPIYLLGIAPLPSVIPQVVSLGSSEEAASYAFCAQKNWNSLDGAKNWLCRKMKKPTETIIEGAMNLESTLPEDTPVIMFDPNALMPITLVK